MTLTNGAYTAIVCKTHLCVIGSMVLPENVWPAFDFVLALWTSANRRGHAIQRCGRELLKE